MKPTNAIDGPLRLLFLADQMGYADGTTHGGTTYFVNALPALARSGIDLTACFMAGRHPAAAALEAQGVEPIFLGRRKWDPLAFFDVLRIVREQRIELLHLASLKSMLFGRWIARVTGARSVIHIHDTSPMPAVMATLERLSAPCTDATIVLTEAMRPWTARQFGLSIDRISVVPNGIDLRRFRNVENDSRQRVRRELGAGEDTPLIVVAGRIVPEKGQDRVIRAMPALLKRIAGVNLCVVGEGSARTACERLARELGVAERVRFTGYRTDIPNVLAAADVVAVPSHNEPFGYAALEAMAIGRPVVGFRAGGLPEVVEDGRTGLLVEIDDESGLVAALTRLLLDSALAARLGEAGCVRAEQFSLERHVDRLRDVYASLCSKVEAIHGHGSPPRPIDGRPAPSGRAQPPPRSAPRSAPRPAPSF